MKEANKLLKILPYDFPQVTPVVRHGDKPVFVRRKKDASLVQQLSEQITELKKEDFQTFAIICKTMRDCEQLYEWYEEKSPGAAKLLREQESIPKDRIVIVPAYLAKGLEFDVVLAVSLQETYKRENELDIKLLYVVMTRPLHRLYFYGERQEDFLLDL